jgi:type II secretory pathway component PulM
LKAQLRSLWKLRTSRERVVVAAVAAVLCVSLLLWLIQSADRGRSQLRTTVTTLRAHAVRLDHDAAEFERLRAVPGATVSHTELRALVQAEAAATGLSRAVVRIDAAGPDQVSVVFGAVAFADWLAWVQSLQSQHVRLETCRIEALSTAGLVSVKATLVRAQAP